MRKSMVFSTFKKYCERKFWANHTLGCEALFIKRTTTKNRNLNCACNESNCPVWDRLMEEGFGL